MLNASARISVVTNSPTVPGAHPIIELPARAPKKRTTMISAMLVALAHGMVRRVKMIMEIVKTGFRPYVSEIGAINNAPKAKPRRYVVSPVVTTVSDPTLYSFLKADVPEV